MNLWEIQPLVVAAISAHPTIFAAGVAVLPDDGTYPKTPLLEDALKKRGLAIIVWGIQSDSLGEALVSGFSVQHIYVPVVVEENAVVNRGENGTQVVIEQALQFVQEAVCGKPVNVKHNLRMKMWDPPFHRFGKVNGVERIVANFTVPNVINGVSGTNVPPIPS